MDPKLARTLLVLTGAALVAGFFLPWFDLGFGGGFSGFQIAKTMPSGASFTAMLWLLPIGGIAMMLTAINDSRYARLTAVLVGLALVGYAVVQAVRVFFATAGLGLWFVCVGALAAILVPLLTRAER